jgi:L-threonylcarbamoyladenylate synthase
LSYIARIDSGKSLKKILVHASKVIEEGGIVAFPTESFYGLGVDATNPEAIKKLYKLKERDSNLPLLILIPSIDELSKYAVSVPPKARIIGENFWPGGITMIFKSSPVLPPELTAGRGKVGIRVSSHPIANGLSREVNLPITATSANLSGTPPCVNADQVAGLFGDDLDLILDGGATEGKNASTILDVTI